jgi:hypothetical protein
MARASSSGPSRRRTGRLVAGAAAVGLALTATAAAQYITFGKNKVHYRSFEWAVLRSPHCDLYYYPEEEALARIALAQAEASYGLQRARFVHDVRSAVPIILYSSHQDFEQTNVTSYMIPEGVAGLTEGARGRVLMPFGGSHPDFARTLRHEMVHAFQFSVVERTWRANVRRAPVTAPLWFTEGLAEHWSRTWDADGDLVLRDLVLAGRLPAIAEFWRYDGTFALYKLGQSVLDFVAQTYGDDKLLLFYTEAGRVRHFDELFPLILGIEQEELSARWTQELRRRYYPEVATGQSVLERGRRVPIWGMEMKPTPVPAGVPGWDGRFVFLSPQSGNASLYGASYGKGDPRPRVLVKGESSPQLLSFHAYESRMDISCDGRLIFSAQSGEHDELTVFDLTRSRVVGRWGFDDLVGLRSPQWDAEGRWVIFAGLRRDGCADLYRLDTVTGERRRLTEDRFLDADPALHPDGRHVAFVSDRGPDGEQGARNLCLLDLETGAVTLLTRGPQWDLVPTWSPDGSRLLFLSTRAGGRDLYTLDLQGRGARLTHAVESILDPRWLPSGTEVIASLYLDERLETIVLPVGPVAPADSIHETPGAPPRALPELPPDTLRVKHEAYQPRFGLDAAQGGVAVDPVLGTSEGLQVLLRDMMGNRIVFLQLGNTAISTQDFADNFSVGVSVLDLSRRLNRGLSVYHHAGNYFDELDRPYFERRVGASALLSYPLSRFTRVETTFGLAYSEKEKPSVDLTRRGPIATHYVSWIHDTSLWEVTGPIDGSRQHLTLGLTMNLRRPGVENVLLLADARRYLRLARHAALAVRLQARASGGPDPQVFLLGGSTTLRGYPWRAFHGTKAVLANAELRVPILRRFMLDPAMVGPVAFPGIQGALFFDLGQTWYDTPPPRARGSYGIGFRMGLAGLLVLRLDLARLTNLHVWPHRTHTEFAVAWNY